MKEKYFPVSESDARNLSHLLYTANRFFDTLISGQDIPSPVWSSRHEIASNDEPHKFYYLSVKEKRVAIHLHRDHTYSLEVYSFVPSKLNPRDIHRGMYRKYFGIFPSLEEAKQSFFDTCIEMLNIELGALF